ncbi:MAG: type II toxin-antitoxin system VapC family toxin [Acidobacteriota bacterium]|nr:type II toxin-antitoxin system VapC family toxin [Acidobacteriota bacterium]
MNLLLDSHAFVWMHEEPHRLSVKVAYEILNPANKIFLSVASAWELQIKIGIGKFSFSDTLKNVIAKERRANNLQILPANLAHTLYLENLPLHHKDPFDRLLISQAIVESMTLVSADTGFAKYQVNLLW